MTYRDSLSPWCIIQHLPKMQRVIIARFRKRNDAEAHLRILKRLNATLTYELLFDPPCESSSSTSVCDLQIDAPRRCQNHLSFF